MLSQESDTQFLTIVVNQMDREEQEEDEFLAGALNEIDQEEEEEEFLRNVLMCLPLLLFLILMMMIPTSHSSWGS